MQTTPSRSEIEQRLRDLVASEFDRRVIEASRRAPRHCVHHIEHTLDDRKVIDDEPNPAYNRVSRGVHLPVVQTIGLCGINYGKVGDEDDDWNGTICEDVMDAKRCPTFTPIWTRETLVAKLIGDFSDIEWVRQQHPEIASLMWILGRTEVPRAIPWWRRLWLRIRGIKVEPQAPPFDATRLLEAPKGS